MLDEGCEEEEEEKNLKGKNGPEDKANSARPILDGGMTTRITLLVIV